MVHLIILGDSATLTVFATLIIKAMKTVLIANFFTFILSSIFLRY
jgi:hypothetical protein